jgi:MoCo/4Fe-4S cofactor protein with predicted Tat translocation signal
MDKPTNKPLNLDVMRSRLAGQSGQQYWRTLEELANEPGFQEIIEDEFPQQSRPLRTPVDRRQFLLMTGASLALAGLSGCRYIAQKKIVPYVEQPEDLVLGVPMHYATSIPLGGFATGVVVTSHEGRPTKLEGNPDHPASLGAIDAITQAQILTMYDPDRSQNVMHLGQISTWEDFAHETRSNLQTSKGAGLRILTETVTSPTIADQIHRILKQYPGAQWHQYEPCGRDNVREGARLALGTPVNTMYHFDKADRILALDADFLIGMPGSLVYARDFADKRRIRTADRSPSQPKNLAMNRLYTVESNYSITGAMADHRIAIRPSQIETVARYIASKLVSRAGISAPALPAGVSQAWVDACVADLQATPKGTSLIIVGDHQPPTLHAVAHAINDALGNVGQTVTYTASVEDRPEFQLASLQKLVEDMNSGAVTMLLILSGNPVYNAPANLNFAEALGRVPSRTHLSFYEDETSALCHWHLPETHALEAWGDARSYDGTVSIVQPLIAPLFQGRSANEVLSILLIHEGDTDTGSFGGIRAGYDIVREFWGRPDNAAASALVPGWSGFTETEFERRFETVLHDGLFRNSASRPIAPTLDVARATAAPAETTAAQGLDVLLLPDPTVYDGRFANNGWLQELPKPITKLTWDNSAIISPATAISLSLAPKGSPDRAFEANNKVITIAGPQGTVDAAVTVLPGHADDTITLHLGYGRTHGGNLANGAGFNAYKLRTVEAMHILTGIKEPVATGEVNPLAHVRAFHSIGTETVKTEELIRVVPIQEFAETQKLDKDEAAVNPVDDEGRQESLYRNASVQEHKYEGFGAYAWGMSIDNNVCIGCNACVTACQAENNIPIVGKDQVSRGRDMLWLRIDTYYRGSYENPASFFEPVPCMHCELAPCEPVCPVAATVHSKEGLNMQIYNRCVGTKYCSNNCPYKVRRFNFYKYVAGQPEPEKMTTNYDVPILKLSANPDVTIRGRGIMEKCTYCVQRINLARIAAKKEEREIRDGEVVTACQQACPTNAIVFGDLHDKTSMVSKLKTEPHDYTLLGDLNTRPRTTYLARLQNQNPALVPASATKRE